MRETVILGAGVIGAATAYYLSLHGIQSTVIERRHVASGASGTAAGLLSAPTPSDLSQPWGPLAQRSLALHFHIAYVLSGPTAYDFEPLQTALVATSPSEREHLINEFGPESWLDADVLARQCPWLKGSSALGGVVRAGSAQLDPARFTSALLDAADAEVVPGKADSVSVEGGQVNAIGVDGVVQPCPRVVVAMGPWSAEAADWFGLPIPVRPLKGQILRLDIPSAPLGGFADLNGNYVVRKVNGLTYTGTTEEEAGFDEVATPGVESQILEMASALAPATRGGEVVARTACLRPLSVDNSPIVGAVPGISGAYVATGHGRKGILMSLATGEALADLIAGIPPSLDLAPFALERFGAST